MLFRGRDKDKSSVPGSAWDRTACEALPRVQQCGQAPAAFVERVSCDGAGPVVIGRLAGCSLLRDDNMGLHLFLIELSISDFEASISLPGHADRFISPGLRPALDREFCRQVQAGRLKRAQVT